MGEECDVRAGVGIDGLPVVSHSNNLGVANLGKCPGKIKALPGDVLVFIDDDVLEV